MGRGISAECELRRANILGARISSAATNPWFDAAIIPVGALPPEDEPGFPNCLWTLGEAVPGRAENLDIATPCMGMRLEDLNVNLRTHFIVDEPPMSVVGLLNEQAYQDFGTFTPLAARLHGPHIRSYGIRDKEEFICVAVSLAVADDISIHYVATEESRRREGLATTLIGSILEDARAEGFTSATLQASPDGLSVYQKIGFEQVGTMRGFLRRQTKRS